MNLSYKRKGFWRSDPYEIFYGDKVIGSVRVKGPFMATAAAKGENIDLRMKWEWFNIFLPKVLFYDSEQELGKFQFNFPHTKGQLEFTSGNRYEFKNSDFLGINCQWLDFSKNILITYKRGLLGSSGVIQIADEIDLSSNAEARQLMYFGIYLIALKGMWNSGT